MRPATPCAAQAILEDTRNCYVHSERALVATIGVKDLVIVDTPDALLVADRARAQDVSGHRRAPEAGRPQGARPAPAQLSAWGYFETLSVGPRFQVKLLHVKPGGQALHADAPPSLRALGGRARHGQGDDRRGRRSWCARTSSVYITATQWHRLENPGKTPLELIEVQIGSYLGEDDIVRSDDVYNRAPDETR